MYTCLCFQLANSEQIADASWKFSERPHNSRDRWNGTLELRLALQHHSLHGRLSWVKRNRGFTGIPKEIGSMTRDGRFISWEKELLDFCQRAISHH